jgi:hypothetical protein
LQVAFSYGHESNPVVAIAFLSELTTATPHAYVPPLPSTYKTKFMHIPVKAMFDAFKGMPKKFAPYRDGWT